MKKRYKEILIILFFAILSTFVFRNYFLKNTVPFPANLLVSLYQPWISYPSEDYPSGPPNKPIGFDNLRIFYPLRKLTTAQIKSFEPPLWNPYYFSGNTLLATYQSAVFHPLSFLFFIFPQIDTWSLIVILTPFLTSIFMYLFLKEIKLSRKASVFGAIVFAFSGFMIVWWEESIMASYSALFLPLILYSTERMFKKITVVSFGLLVFSLAFSILSGWFQMTLYVWIFSIAWMIFLQLQQKGKNWTPFIYTLLGYFLAILISAIHLFPSAEAYFYSARGSTDAKFLFDEYLLPLQNLITLIAPDFFGNPATYNYFGKGFFYERVIYIGIPALIFALYGLISRKKNNREGFLKWSFLITLSLGFSLPTSWFLLYYLKIPLISVIIPSRIFFLSIFSASALAAFGIERYLVYRENKKLVLILLLIALAFFIGWIFVFYSKWLKPDDNFSNVSFRNLILPTGIYVVFFLTMIASQFSKTLRAKVYVPILLITILSALYFANKYLYFSDRKFLYPQTPVVSKLKEISGISRFWSFGKGYIETNFTIYNGLFSPEGYDSFYIRRYGELLFAAQNKGKFSAQIPRADARLISAETPAEVLDNPYRKKLLSLLGVRYILEKNKKEDKSRPKKIDPLLNPVWKDSKFTIYEYKQFFPRIFLVGNYLVSKDQQEILDNIFDEKTNLQKTVILEEKPKNFTKSDKIESSVNHISYRPNKIIINEDADKDSLLFISDNYFPGWKAYVDNIETKIHRANYTFRAIVVPKGSHEIVFEYKPLSFYIGIFASAFGLLIFLRLSFKIKYNKK